MPLDVFMLTFKPAPNPRPYYRAHLTLEGFPSVVGYVNGDLWNGWAKPFFEHDEVLKMAQDPDHCLIYEAERDRWVCELSEDDDPEVWERSTIWVGDTVVSGFWIGAGSWCWDADPT